MKGTVARGLTLEEDRQQAAWLQSDPKNRSENMMIVDLLRNDLGKVCQIGSVKVKALCQLEQYSTVWQMTSTVEGILEEGADLVSVFGALYPCGSITGAPKIATMSLINELEDKPRGVYCGAVGICMPEGRRSSMSRSEHCSYKAVKLTTVSEAASLGTVAGRRSTMRSGRSRPSSIGSHQYLT